MKRIKLPAIAIAVFMPLFYSCNSSPKQEGKPYDELPALEKSDVLAFFKAIPASDLPEMIADGEKREKYFERFVVMRTDGALGDGDDMFVKPSSDNSLYWSDYLEAMDAVEVEENDNTPHPYASIHVYSGAQQGKLFGVLNSGAYVCGDDKKNPEKCYWFDSASGKMTSSELPLDPPYTEGDLTADPLLLYGAENLYYAIKNGIYHNYYDRGLDVSIEGVGFTGVCYEWNGVNFVRESGKPIQCIWNWGFANFNLGSKISWDIPAYSTNFISASAYEHTYTLVKSGEAEPTLVFITNEDDEMFMIEVCSGKYSNPYGIYPGMRVAEFLKKVNEIGAMFPEPPYISYNDDGEDFVVIYTGIDEDFVYKVSKDQYLGNEKFSDDAVIARVCVMNAVG